MFALQLRRLCRLVLLQCWPVAMELKGHVGLGEMVKWRMRLRNWTRMVKVR